MGEDTRADDQPPTTSGADSGFPAQPARRFDPKTTERLAGPEPVSGQQAGSSSTRFIPRPPSRWWIAAQALWLVILIPVLGHALSTGSKVANPIIGFIELWACGGLVLAVISYGHRRIRHLA